MIIRTALSRLKPKARETHYQFATRVKLPDGRREGDPYNPKSHQVQDAILQETLRGYVKLTIVKPVQDGGTLVALIILFYRAIALHQFVVVAFPTMKLAQDIWTTKILPVLRAFGGQEPVSGGVSGADRIIVLPGGGKFALRTSGGTGESGQAAISADVMMIDEFDDWPSLDRTRAIAQRIEEAADPFIIQPSTVKKISESILLGEYQAGTASRMHYPCPHCGEFQTLDWKCMKWDEDDGRLKENTERIVCQKNGCVIAPALRRGMLFKGKLLHKNQTIAKDGAITGECPNKKHLSVMWNRLESPRKTLATTVEAYLEARFTLEAQGDHGPMKRFYHDYLSVPYTGELEELESSPVLKPQLLAQKSQRSTFSESEHTSDTIRNGDQMYGLFVRNLVKQMPTDAEGIIAAIDVQHNRVYWGMTAVAANTTEYDVGWGIEYARADQTPGTDDEMWLLFNRTAELIFSKCGGLPWIVGGIDCGDQRDLVRKWADTYHNRGWRAVRGDVLFKAEGPPDIDGISCVREGQIFLHTDHLRDLFHQSIRRPENAPGAVIFPRGLTTQSTQYFKHLCKRQTIVVLASDRKTKRTDTLVQSGREDWLDIRAYIRGLHIGWRAQMGQLDRSAFAAKAAAAAAATDAARQSLGIKPGAFHVPQGEDEEEPRRVGSRIRFIPANGAGRQRNLLQGRRQRWRT